MTPLQPTAALACLAVCAATSASGGSASPIAKVVSMMNDMVAKGKQEKQDEKVSFAAFRQFCTSTLAEKKSAIEKGKESAEALAADIDKAATDAAKFRKEVAAIDAELKAWDEDRTKAVALRKKEKAVFQKTHSEYVDSIASTEAALARLSEEPASEPASLLQLARGAGGPMSALLQDGDASTALAPEAAAFASSSGSIIEMVEKMQEKFVDEKAELEKREMNMQQSHDLMVADLSGSIKQGKMERGMKTAATATAEQSAAEAKGELASVKAAIVEDTKFRADLDAECVSKSRDFEKRQVMRAAEIEAINKAIEIMSSPEVMGLVQRAPLRRGTMFGQLRSATTAPRLARAVDFLSTGAKRVRSPILSLLATRMATTSGADIFKKVRKMISDMINKLMEEANQEATQKGFCDTEMSTNKMTRDTLTEEIGSLKSTIEKLSADISQLAEEMAAIQQALSTIDSQVAKANEDRNAEKAKNQSTISDAKVAQAATVKAIEVLKEFQTKAANQPKDIKVSGPIAWDQRALTILKGGGATLLEESTARPKMASGEYTGMEGGGVVGLLEVIESDFAGVVSETEASEAQAATSHSNFLNDASQDKAVKDAELTHTQEVSTEKSSDLAEARKNLKGADREFTAAEDYFEKLKPDCIDEGESYEEKVARRKEEIESLQEALKILSGDGI